MVVTDTRPGSADDLWLCSRAIALAPAAPAGHLFYFGRSLSSFPTFSAVGRDDTSRTHTQSPQRFIHEQYVFFLIFLLPPRLRAAHHACTEHPPHVPSFIALGAVTTSRPLSSPLSTSHITFPSPPLH